MSSKAPERASVVLLVLATMLLSGCLRYTEALRIGSDDTVSGVIVLAARTPDPISAANAPKPPAGAAIPQPHSDSPHIVVTDFRHNSEHGYKVTFTNATFDEVTAFAPLGKAGGALRIIRDGDLLRIDLTADLSYDVAASDRAYIELYSTITVSLQVPGTVRKTDGEVTDDTITWKLIPFQVNQVSATVDAPIGVETQVAATHSIDPGWAVMFGLVAAGLITLAWRIIRRLAPRGAPRHALASAGAARGTGPMPVQGLAPSKVRREQLTLPGGWPPPRPRWKEQL